MDADSDALSFDASEDFHQSSFAICHLSFDHCQCDDAADSDLDGRNVESL